jgi:hypothetical protein
MAGWGVVALTFSALAACNSTSGGGDDAPGLSARIILAGTTMPPPMTVAAADVYCPPVEIVDGGAAMQSGGGQIALGQLARECLGQPDGSTLVKVGVEARALLSASGGSRRYAAPITVVVKDGSAIFATRTRQAAIGIPAGDSQGTVTLVEDNIIVPAGSADSFEIQVSLGGRRRG